MVSRRQFAAVIGLAATGGVGIGYKIINSSVGPQTKLAEATGGSESSDICQAPAQKHPDETLSILGVRANETSISVGYEIESDRRVDSVSVAIDGEEVARKPWNGSSADIAFSHEEPTTFEVRAHSEEGDVLDSAEILVECGPIEE